jgi:hypothetical protein
MSTLHTRPSPSKGCETRSPNVLTAPGPFLRAQIRSSGRVELLVDAHGAAVSSLSLTQLAAAAEWRQQSETWRRRRGCAGWLAPASPTPQQPQPRGCLPVKAPPQVSRQSAVDDAQLVAIGHVEGVEVARRPVPGSSGGGAGSIKASRVQQRARATCQPAPASRTWGPRKEAGRWREAAHRWRRRNPARGRGREARGAPVPLRTALHAPLLLPALSRGMGAARGAAACVQLIHRGASSRSGSSVNRAVEGGGSKRRSGGTGGSKERKEVVARGWRAASFHAPASPRGRDCDAACLEGLALQRAPRPGAKGAGGRETGRHGGHALCTLTVTHSRSCSAAVAWSSSRPAGPAPATSILPASRSLAGALEGAPQTAAAQPPPTRSPSRGRSRDGCAPRPALLAPPTAAGLRSQGPALHTTHRDVTSTPLRRTALLHRSCTKTHTCPLLCTYMLPVSDIRNDPGRKARPRQEAGRRRLAAHATKPALCLTLACPGAQGRWHKRGPGRTGGATAARRPPV